MSRIILIDAYAQIYRCYYAIQTLNNGKGEPVNALFGMARMMLNLHEAFPSDYGAVVFDLGKCTRRCQLLPSYKAQRPPMPDDLKCQTPKIKEWVAAFGWPIVEKFGVEADDLIAGITAERRDCQVQIFSRDKDLAQLLGKDVTMYSAGKQGGWIPMGVEEAVEKFGVGPEAVCDYLALIGDTADNIPGVEGIGPKTAAKLIAEFGSVECMLNHLDAIPNEKLRGKIMGAQEQLAKNLQLVRLDRILPDNWNGLAAIQRKAPDWKRIAELAANENFKSISSTVNKKLEKEAPAPRAFEQLTLF